MSRHPVSGTCRDTATGQVRGSSTVSVYLAGGVVPASIYAAVSGGVAVNSVISDTHGKFLFYIDELDYPITQLFKIVTSKTGYDSSTYDNLSLFSLQCIDTDKALSANSDNKIPSQKAVKDYIDTVAAAISAATGSLPSSTAENDFIISNGSFNWVKKTLAETITILGLSDYVTKALFDANTILSADSDNTPAALTVAEQRLVGRKTGGSIDDITMADALDFMGGITWMQDINVFNTPEGSTNFSSLVSDTRCIMNGKRQSTGAQNAEVYWPVVLSKGTWTFSLMHVTASDAGIYSIQIDSVEKGTIDGYSGSGAANTVSTVVGITVATTGKYTLKVKMATKNGSSSSYYGYLQSIRMIRTV